MKHPKRAWHVLATINIFVVLVPEHPIVWMTDHISLLTGAERFLITSDKHFPLDRLVESMYPAHVQYTT